MVAQPEERERMGARMIKEVKVGGECVAANDASEEEGVSTTARRRKIFCDDKGLYLRQRPEAESIIKVGLQDIYSYI